jgi:glycine/D-amino acid oxidase-like deaminating enzyme
MSNLPTPDFTFDPTLAGACVAGVRPYRNGSYRLEAVVDLAGKFVVHNYGHGGAGITLSWGCAAKVRDLVKRHLVGTNDAKVAVLGAGVMGLTAATRLRELGLAVTIYSDRRPLDTTSAKAGGQWAVSVVEYKGKERELTDIIKIAYTTFKASIGKGFGVFEQPNYTASPSHNLDVVIQLAPGLIPPRVALRRLPFEGHTTSGFVYQTLLIEPPVFLAKLEADLKTQGAVFVTRKFTGKADIQASVPENIVVNCTGLGSMKLFSDAKMQPIKGQLAMLPAQPALQYLYGQNGYLFPRGDHVVIGGTFEVGVDNETPDPKVCKGLVDHVASEFGKASRTPMSNTHIHHPDNAEFVDPDIPIS